MAQCEQITKSGKQCKRPAVDKQGMWGNIPLCGPHIDAWYTKHQRKTYGRED